MANKLRKGAQNLYSSGKCKSNHNEVSPHQSAWLASKIQKINIDEHVEKRENLYTAGGDVNWYNHYGK